MFRIAKNHKNYVFGNYLLPKVPGGGAASYKLRPVFTYDFSYEKSGDFSFHDIIMVIGKCRVGFRGFFLDLGAGLRGGGYVGGSFLGEIFHEGTEIQ